MRYLTASRLNFLRQPRLSMRSRLTLLYGGLFLIAGGILIAILYIIFTSNFPGGHLAEGIFPPTGRRLPPPGPPLTQAEMRALVQKLDQHRSEIISSLLRESLLALAVVAVAAVGFGWLMAGRALRAVRHITDTARRVAGSNLHERISLVGPRDELKELADTFDAMLERLDASFDGQRHFAANASHELRTPLATNRTLLEVAVAQHRVPPELRQVIDTVLAASARSELILDGLLTLARCENQAIERLPVDLSDVAAGAVEETAARSRCRRGHRRRGTLSGTHDRRPRPPGTPRAQPRPQRHPAQPPRRLGHSDHPDGRHARHGRTRGKQLRAARPARAGRHVVRALPAARAATGPATRTAPGSACPSSGPSSRPTAGS